MYKISKDGKGRGWYILLDNINYYSRGVYLNNLGEVSSPTPDVTKLPPGESKSIWFIGEQWAEQVAEGYVAKLKAKEEKAIVPINGVLAILNTKYSEYLGVEEGEICNRGGCPGIIIIAPPENCSCHICSPCYDCTSCGVHCSECGWEAE